MCKLRQEGWSYLHLLFISFFPFASSQIYVYCLLPLSMSGTSRNFAWRQVLSFIYFCWHRMKRVKREWCLGLVHCSWSQHKGTGAPLGTAGSKSCYEPSSSLKGVWYLDWQTPWQFSLSISLSVGRKSCEIPNQITDPALNKQTLFPTFFFEIKIIFLHPKERVTSLSLRVLSLKVLCTDPWWGVWGRRWWCGN